MAGQHGGNMGLMEAWALGAGWPQYPHLRGGIGNIYLVSEDCGKRKQKQNSYTSGPRKFAAAPPRRNRVLVQRFSEVGGTHHRPSHRTVPYLYVLACACGNKY
ncbi:hypothetical protein J6590_005185 [Homalodisca vitripennis]|nr:hypothetical protein J6590_005185 [Homalodisca vitripennis]